MCLNSVAGYKRNAVAYLRVISSPWSYVEVDGRQLGISGQPEPFEILTGKHTITLKRDGQVLTKTLKLCKGDRFVIKALLEKGQIDVKPE
jgi:hypothetical protein